MMSERDLKLQVVWSMLDKITGPLKKIGGESNATAKALKATRDRLKELDVQQKQVGQFREMSNGLRAGSARLKEAQQRVRELAQQMKAVENPTRAMTREFDRATAKAKAIKEANRQQAQQLQILRDRLAAAGISTGNLGAHERALRTNLAATNTQLAAQQKHLATLTSRQERLSAAREKMNKTRAFAGNLAAAGAGATVSGAAVGMPVKGALDEARLYQREISQFRALGVGEPELQKAISFSNSLNIKGLSQRDNLKLLKEAYSITRDMHHAEEITPLLAKMKFGIEAVMQKTGKGEGHGEIAEQMLMDLVKTAELRGSLKSPQAFRQAIDNATKAFVASGGTITPEEMLQSIKTGGIAAKQLGDNSFYFGLLHTMQEMGGFRAGTGLMSAYTNWAQGRTTQQSAEELVKAGLIRPDAVKYGKTGHVTKVLPDALKNIEKYKTDPFAFLLEDVIPKINPNGKLTDQQVISRIGQLFSSRKGGDLMASLFLERANIQKHRAAAPKAFGVEQLYREGGMNVDGSEIESLAKLRDLQLELGTQILPLYTSALQSAASAMKALNRFAKEHPALAKGMMIGLAGLAGILMVVGPLMLGLSALLGPIALLRYAMEGAAIKGSLFGRVIGGIGGVFGRLGGAVGMLVRLVFSPIRMLATSLLPMLAGAIAATPIGWIAAAVLTIAAAGLALYKYWEPVKAFLAGMFEGIGSALEPLLGLFSVLGEALAPLKPVWDAISKGMTQFWAWLKKLIEPMHATQEQLDSATGAGRRFGEVVGMALRFLLMPIEQTVRAIAVLPGLVISVWSEIRQAFSGGLAGVSRLLLDWSPLGLLYKAFAAVMRWFGVELPGKFSEFGANLLRGLVDGITGALGWVKQTIMGAGESVIGWFKEKLGIRSPSRVFAELGGFTMQGLADGLDRGQDGPLQQIDTLAKRLAQIGAGIAIGTAALPAMAFDTRPPVSRTAAAAASIDSHDTIQIHIHAAPGMDPQAIARAVSAELDRREREKAARMRSSLHDY